MTVAGSAEEHEPVLRVPDSNLSLPPAVSGSGDGAPPGPIEEPAVEPEPVSRGALVLLVAATFGSSMALIVPMAFSLVLRVDQLAPGRADYLGYILGVGSIVSLIAAPLTGILSDRTRSRLGRRRPFTIAGVLVGLSSIPVMAAAPTIPVLALGWVLSTVGWGTAGGSIGNYQADRLAPSQRGKVAGLVGMSVQVAPVVGILLAGLVTESTLLVFLLPAAIGTLLILPFVVLVPDGDSRGLRFDDRLSVIGVLRSFAFSPRAHPDFGWNFLGRFVFFVGLTLVTSYSTFLYAQRLDLDVSEVAGVIAIISGTSVVTSTVGSLLAGALSDRIGRRLPFIAIGTSLFAAGAVLSALAMTFPALMAGALLSSFGIAVFLAVNQAVVLDILPGGATEAGRYLAIVSFSQKIPNAIAPMLAPILLSIGATSQPNFAALYIAAACLAAIGGLIVSGRVKGVR